MRTLPSISAIIPALNEEDTIGNVIHSLLSHGVNHVIVVDNGSTDDTACIAHDAGAQVVTEERRGYGRACLSGIAALPKTTEWVLFCDADGSDDLSELYTYWPHLETHDFLVGNRRATAAGRANLTPVQNFGNWLSGFLMRLGWGRGFSDLGPLRMIRAHSLHALEMQDENFGWTVEMQAKSLEQKLRIKEIPVNYLPRQGGISKISGNFRASAKAGQIILTTLGSLWLQRPVVQTVLLFLSALLLIVGSGIMGLLGDPASSNEGGSFFLGAGCMIGGFLLALTIQRWKLLPLFTLAILARLLLLPMEPGDDIWRYLWEGLVQLHGHNPFNTPPASESLSGIRPEWWSKINHPEVTAIYPPLAQLVFRLLALISASALHFKLWITLADLAIGWLLWKRFGSSAFLYLLNPLAIYSSAGGGHYDPLFILPLVAAWICWEHHRSRFLVGLLLGASISIKVVAIMAAGFIGWKLFLRLCRERSMAALKSITLYGLGVLTVPILSYGLFSALSGAPDQLYPTEFAAKARSASLIPWIAEHFNTHPYDAIPNENFLLPLVITLVVVLLSAKKVAGFYSRSTLALLAFSPMVHAWYFTWLLPFSLTRHRVTIIAFSITSFIYFLLPYRLATHGEWTLSLGERIILWSPLLLMLLSRRTR